MLDRSAQPNLFDPHPGAASAELGAAVPRSARPSPPRTAPRSRAPRHRAPATRTWIGGRLRPSGGRLRLALRYGPVVGLLVVFLTHVAGFGSGASTTTRAARGPTAASAPAASAAAPVLRRSRAQILPLRPVQTPSRRAPGQGRRVSGRSRQRIASAPAVRRGPSAHPRVPSVTYTAADTTPPATYTPAAAAVPPPPRAYTPVAPSAAPTPSPPSETSSPSDGSQQRATGEFGFEH